MKIDFTKFKMFTDIAHTNTVEVNVKNDIADVLYKYGTGIAMNALALKIYNSEGEIELTQEEYDQLLSVIEKISSPMFIGSLMEYNKKDEENDGNG